MADRIKGITIEIDGDTKGLSQALKGVNKDIKSTQTQLKDVEKLLKLDPHNVTLLGQKMKLLGGAISQTREKLDQLKSVKEKMDEGLKNGSVTAEQYDAWQREIIQTENELKNLESELAKVPTASEAMIAKVSEDMDKLGQKVSNVGDKMASIGDTMSKTVTAGIVAVGTASVSAFNEMDSAMDGVIAKTGATGAELEGLQGIVESIATTIPVDFDKTAQAVAEVSTRLDLAGDNLETVSTAFLEFSELNGTDVVGSIDTVSAMMKAWGLEASDTVAVLNTLNGVGQRTGASVSELASLLQNNALSFKEMGYDVADATVLLGQMEKNGLDASTGVMALRKAMAKAVSDGTSLNDVMSEWEEIMSSNISETEKLTYTEEIFGSKAFAPLYNAIKEGNISFTDINASMGQFSGNLKNTFEATLDPADEFTTTMNELKILGAEIGEEVLPVLVDVLRDLKPILDSIKEAWEEMSPEDQKKLIENLGKIALIGPALSVSGRAIGGVGSAISGLAKAGKALSGLGIGAKLGSLFGGGSATAGATAGAGLGTALLGGLAGALAGGAVAKLIDNYIIAPILDLLGSDSAEWYKNFTWFGDGGFFDEMFDFNSLSEAIDVYVGAFQLMGEDIRASFENTKENVISVWNAICDGLSKKVDDIKTKITDTWTNIKESVTGAVDTIESWLSSTWETIKSKVTDTWEFVKDKILGVWEDVKKTFTEWKDNVFDTFTQIYDKIKEVWDSLGEMFEAGFDIKLPHITVSGGQAPYGIGGQGSLPKFDVEWYKNGGILTQPTIFGMQGGKLLGGGEAGAEAVLPLSNLEEMIVNGMTMALGNGGDTVINVSIDNNNLGSVLLTAQQMMNLRRGK